MGFEHILVERSGDFATITMNRPQKRNALSLDHMRELIQAFSEVGESSALGIVLAGNGPVFSAGHDFADVVEADLSGDVIDARTALDWGLVNKVVPAVQLDSAVQDMLERVTRGSAESKGIGKQALYAQIDLDQPKAYAYAIEVMAATSQLPDAREGMHAFLEKRKPQWRPRF